MIAVENTDSKVAERVLKRLKVEPPAQELVELYLQEIAKTYNVPYGTSSSSSTNGYGGVGSGEGGEGADDDDDAPGSGALLEEPVIAEQKLMQIHPPQNEGPRSPIAVIPPNPTTDNLKPTVKIPQPNFKAQEPKKPVQKVQKTTSPDFDELSRRFAALKKLPGP